MWASRRSAGARTATARSREAGELGLPVFVKPAHLGSSVGIVKVAAARASSAGALDGRVRRTTSS